MFEDGVRLNFNPMGNMRMPTVINGGGMNPAALASQQQQAAMAQQQQAQRAPQMQQKFRPPQPQQQAPQPVVPNPQAINVPGQEPLTTGMLAAAQPQEQKQMLGERLYPLIHSMHADWAGKITGMLLEIDNAELLHMLDSRESLKAKVDEAVVVLQAHQAKQTVTQRQTEQ